MIGVMAEVSAKVRADARARIIALALWPLTWLQGAQGHLFVFVPVFMGLGVGIWFAGAVDPLPWHYGAAMVAVLLGLAGVLRGPHLARPLLWALICTALGFGAAGIRAAVVAAPMLEFHYYGAVMGRVIGIDRSQSDALRITLDHLVLDNLPPDQTPKKARISLQGAQSAPLIGQVVMLTAHLSAPSGAAAPGDFDFRRMAFFQGLGALGYTRSPVLLWQEPAAGAQRIDRLRSYLAASMMQAMPSQAGAFATGAMTGDRAAITQDTVEALRNSNLAHLLAISGMNLAFLAGFVFMLIRYGLALAPPLALRVNAKKIAAVVALGVALFYWLLSGANVSTTRAMLMITVMLGAVLLDRQAISMRAVAISAIILLLVQPESLFDAGFQLSFAATVALVGGYAALTKVIARGRLPRWMMPVYALLLTSVVAGLATAPYAAAHFNRFTDYGLLANVLTAWAMSVLMAAGVMAAILAPLGAQAPAIWAMEMSSAWILAVAHWVAGLEGAVTMIPAPMPAVLPLITLGGLWFLVWHGRRRWAGVPVLALALGLWASSPRPDLLISADGRLVGLMGPDGRALSLAKGAGFAAQTWLENDGDLASQAQAAARAGFAGPKGAHSFTIGPYRGVVMAGKDLAERFAVACAGHDLVILPSAFDPSTLPPLAAHVTNPPLAAHVTNPLLAGNAADVPMSDSAAQSHAAAAQPKANLPCAVIDRRILDNSGALAGGVEQGKLVLYPTHDRRRIWGSPRPIIAPIVLDAPKS